MNIKFKLVALTAFIAFIAAIGAVAGFAFAFTILAWLI